MLPHLPRRSSVDGRMVTRYAASSESASSPCSIHCRTGCEIEPDVQGDHLGLLAAEVATVMAAKTHDMISLVIVVAPASLSFHPSAHPLPRRSRLRIMIVRPRRFRRRRLEGIAAGGV